MAPDRASGQRGAEAGFSLVEVMVVSALLLLAGSVFTGTLVSIQNALTRHTEQSVNNDQARLALEQIDREVRSGSLLYNPADDDLPASGIYSNYSLRVYTQSNGLNRCIQYRIQNRQMQRRVWAPSFGNPPSSVGGWNTVATGVVNRDLTPPVPAFTLVSPSGTSVGRTVQVVFVVNQALERRPNQTARVQQSITGRNTSSGQSLQQNACSPVPS